MGWKINRSSTPAEKKFEGSLSGEAKDNYASMNHDNAVREITESNNEGWHTTQVGVTETNWKG